MLATVVAAVAYNPTTAAETHNSKSIWDHGMWFGYNTITIFGKSDYKLWVYCLTAKLNKVNVVVNTVVLNNIWVTKQA